MGDAAEAATLDLASIKAEDVVRERAGDVLLKNTLLKADHFPGCQNTKLTPLLEGAPNFRQVEGLPVYGVAIPTVRGVRNVLDAVGAAKGARRVLWHNLREEPVLYVNGKPYVVREADQPFCNLEYTGIDRSRVEDMEARLKRDVLSEAALFDNHILVTEEDDDMQVVDRWEPVTEADVQTPLDVYRELKADGYDVEYVRLPITDEKAPKDSDFEVFVRRLWNVPPTTALIFNCQMGRGRTTTGMVVCCLLIGLVCPEYFKDLEERYPKLWEEADSPYAKGNYKCILQLRSVLSDGRVAKRRLDLVLEACNKMQNLRTAIEMFKSQVESPDLPEEARGRAHHHGVNYLRRYFNLIAFTSYLYEEFNRESGRFNSTFAEWMEARAELRHLHDTAALL